MEAHQDPKPVFKHLIQSAQQSAEHPRGSEDNYFQLLLRAMTLSPWSDYQDESPPSVPDQKIATASEFAHKLAEAANFQELAQIETAFIRRLLSSKDFAQETTETAADSLKTVFLVAPRNERD
jgi:hypothetical protein